jgi:hypothetical protein
MPPPSLEGRLGSVLRSASDTKSRRLLATRRSEIDRYKSKWQSTETCCKTMRRAHDPLKLQYSYNHIIIYYILHIGDFG